MISCPQHAVSHFPWSLQQLTYSWSVGFGWRPATVSYAMKYVTLTQKTTKYYSEYSITLTTDPNYILLRVC